MKTGRVDVVMTFYHKWRDWLLVVRGLEANRDYINRVIVVNDEPWEEKTLELCPPPKEIPTLFIGHPHNGWGAARCANEGAEKVDTEFFLHLMLGTDSILESLKIAKDGLLLACLMDDIPESYEVIYVSQGGLRIKAKMFARDTRVENPRTPKPRNLRAGHYLAHTETWKSVGGHDLTPPLDTKRHSLDYSLAARWMLKNGEDSFMVGGGTALHLGAKVFTGNPEPDPIDAESIVNNTLSEWDKVFLREGSK